MCRSFSAPPQVGTAADSVTEASLLVLDRPDRPKSCNAHLPARPVPRSVDRFAARDRWESESPATSPISPTFTTAALVAKYEEATGEPLKDLPAVETLTIKSEPELGGNDIKQEPLCADETSSHTEVSVTGKGSLSVSPRSSVKWWQSGPSPYLHRPLTLVNTTASSAKAGSSTAREPEVEPLERGVSVAPADDDEELSELDSGSEIGASEAPSSPYLTAVSTPVDSTTPLQGPPSPLKSTPAVKPKRKAKANQLLELQTYSTSILGEATLMSAKRTRQRRKSDNVCRDICFYLTLQATSDASSPVSTPLPPSKRQRIVSTAKKATKGGDLQQATTVSDAARRSC